MELTTDEITGFIDIDRRAFAFRLRIFEAVGKPSIAIATPVEHENATVPLYADDGLPSLLKVDDGLWKDGKRVSRHAERLGESIGSQLTDPYGGLLLLVHSPEYTLPNGIKEDRYFPQYYSEVTYPNKGYEQQLQLEGYRACFHNADNLNGISSAVVAGLIAPGTLEHTLENSRVEVQAHKLAVEHDFDIDF